MLTKAAIRELETVFAPLRALIPDGQLLLVENLVEPDEDLAHFETCFLLVEKPKRDTPRTCKAVSQQSFSGVEMNDSVEVSKRLAHWLKSSQRREPHAFFKAFEADAVDDSFAPCGPIPQAYLFYGGTVEFVQLFA